MNQHRRKPASTPLRVHFHSTFGLLPIYFRSTSGLLPVYTCVPLLVYFPSKLPVYTSGIPLVHFWSTSCLMLSSNRLPVHFRAAGLLPVCVQLPNSHPSTSMVLYVMRNQLAQGTCTLQFLY